MAQLVERSFTTQEIRSSNPDISKILSTNCTIEKTKIKKKRPGIAHLKKIKTAVDNNAPISGEPNFSLSEGFEQV